MPFSLFDFFFWFFAGPAVLATLIGVKTGRKYQEYVEISLLAEQDPEEENAELYRPPVTLILPVKGVDHDLAANLRSLAEQDYPDYELLITCRSEDDPAVQTARVTLGDRFRLIVAGPPPEGTGEKINNLLAAVASARPESEVLVFADSDGQVTAGWLTALIEPLADEELGAASGFRWYFPEDGGFWPLMRSVWDSTVANLLGAKDSSNFAWGGAMAIRRSVFNEAEVANYWRGTVSDDYRLTKAVKDAGKGIRYLPNAMVATPGSCTRAEFLKWAERQLVITKVYNKSGWIAGFVAHVMYCGAMLMAAAALLRGDPLGLGVLLVILIPGMAKGAMRSYAGRLMFPEREAWFDQHGWAYFWLTPLATWIWLYLFVQSARTRTIRWRGYEYELVSADATRVKSAEPLEHT